VMHSVHSLNASDICVLRLYKLDSQQIERFGGALLALGCVERGADGGQHRYEGLADLDKRLAIAVVDEAFKGFHC